MRMKVYTWLVKGGLDMHVNYTTGGRVEGGSFSRAYCMQRIFFTRWNGLDSQVQKELFDLRNALKEKERK